MADPAQLAPAFRYADVAPAHRDWLRAQAEHVNALAYRTVCDYVRIGQVLAEARRRVRRPFRRWVAAELPFSRAWAYHLMRIAAAFGPHVRPDAPEQIDSKALVLLAAAPPGARAYALEQAAGGRRVTEADAREIVAAHRPQPDPTRAEAREYERGARGVLGPDATRAPAGDEARAAAAWAMLQRLAGLGGVVTVGTVDDADPDAGDSPAYHVAALLPAGRRDAVRRSLADAVAAVLGEEPTHECPGCKARKPVGEFGADGSRPSGKSTYCKACARERTARGKKLKRAARAALEGREPDGL